MRDHCNVLKKIKCILWIFQIKHSLTAMEFSPEHVIKSSCIFLCTYLIKSSIVTWYYKIELWELNLQIHLKLGDVTFREGNFLHCRNASNVVCSRHFCSLTILFSVHQTLLHILWPASLPLFSAFATNNNNENLAHCPIFLLICTLTSSFPQQSLYYSLWWGQHLIYLVPNTKCSINIH